MRICLVRTSLSSRSPGQSACPDSTRSFLYVVSYQSMDVPLHLFCSNLLYHLPSSSLSKTIRSIYNQFSLFYTLYCAFQFNLSSSLISSIQYSFVFLPPSSLCDIPSKIFSTYNHAIHSYCINLFWCSLSTSQIRKSLQRNACLLNPFFLF